MDEIHKLSAEIDILPKHTDQVCSPVVRHRYYDNYLEPWPRYKTDGIDENRQQTLYASL